MSDPAPRFIAPLDPGASDPQALAMQILEVRAVMVALLMDGMSCPVEPAQRAALHALWDRLRGMAIGTDEAAPIAEASTEAFTEAEWALRQAFFRLGGNGMALHVLLTGEETLRQLYGGQAPARDINARLQAMEALMVALDRGDREAAWQAAATQIEWDQHDLKSFWGFPQHRLGNFHRH